jgi:hypothetical protein
LATATAAIDYNLGLFFIMTRPNATANQLNKLLNRADSPVKNFYHQFCHKQFYFCSFILVLCLLGRPASPRPSPVPGLLTSSFKRRRIEPALL